MPWIKELETVDSVEDLMSSSSVRGIQMPNFEVFDARIASALNKIIHNSHFKRRISLEEQNAPEAGPFPSRQADCLLKSTNTSRSLGAMILSRTYADLFTISLRNDDLQEFDSKWDGILLSMSQIPSDDILKRESLRNSRPYWLCMTWRFIRRN